MSATTIPVLPTPALQLSDIQGNILAGFNKDHQRFLFFEINDAAKAKAWLQDRVPGISDCQTVKQANDQRKADLQDGKVPANAHWMNIAFNFPAFEKLGATELKDFPQEFKDGMAHRNGLLGDTGTNAPGQWDPWLKERDFLNVMLILAADDPADLQNDLATILASLPTSGLTLIHTESGEAPPGVDSPNEHFGFRDGISQPGIKGFTASVGTDPTQGIPGQDLLWPGEFVLGYPTQIDTPDPNVDGPNPNPGPASNHGPDWGKNGSYLVFRKLEQDVAGFRNSVHASAAALGVDPEVLGAKMVGRFRSGCPMEKLSNPPNGVDPNNGDPSKADPTYLEQLHINDFEYGGDLPGDFAPRSAHVRKAYPRDEKFLTPTGVEDTASLLNESSTQTHRILRRGIPFGPYMPIPFTGLTTQFTDDGLSRGLLFLCYQSSIQRQFEFIQTQWVNKHNFPDPADGVDPIMSQVKVAPMQCPFKGHATPTTFDLRHYVTTNGGEYFFQPSLSALKMLAA